MRSGRLPAGRTLWKARNRSENRRTEIGTTSRRRVAGSAERRLPRLRFVGCRLRMLERLSCYQLDRPLVAVQVEVLLRLLTLRVEHPDALSEHPPCPRALRRVALPHGVHGLQRPFQPRTWSPVPGESHVSYSRRSTRSAMEQSTRPGRRWTAATLHMLGQQEPSVPRRDRFRRPRTTQSEQVRSQARPSRASEARASRDVRRNSWTS